MARAVSFVLLPALACGAFLGCRELASSGGGPASPPGSARLPGPPAPASAASAIASAPPAPDTSCETLRDCDQDPANHCETDVRTSKANCGACGRACADDLACVAGECRLPRVLAATLHGACAVVSGRVMCWGDAPAGGNPRPATSPAWVPGTEGAVSVATSVHDACAVLATGALVCWDDRPPRTVVPGGAVDVLPNQVGSASYEVLFVWSDGRLGSVTDNGVQGPQVRPVKTPLAGLRAVAGERPRTCALADRGAVQCWGDGEYTGGADSSADTDATAPVKVTGLDDASQISVFSHTACAARRNGRVVCWGSWSRGGFHPAPARLPPEKQRTLPVEIPGVAGAVEVAAGHDHACARLASGKVVCWGPDARRGQLGGGPAKRDGVVEVAGVTDALGIAAGDGFTCAMRRSGAIACWGSASRGQLGDGSMREVAAPRAVAGVTGAAQIGAGDGFTCALTGSSGQATCWGAGDAQWQPGLGAPEVVKGIQGVKGLFVRGEGLCFQDAGGKVSCLTGAQRAGTRAAAPVKDVKRVVFAPPTGGAGLLGSGQVVFWRGNKAKKVAGLSDAVDMALDPGSSPSTLCAVRRAGTVSCVGYERSPFAARRPGTPSAPFRVGKVSDATAIAAGARGYCVTRKTGEVACFSKEAVEHVTGAARSTAGSPPRLEAAPVAGITGATQVAASSEAWCALLSAGTVSCWGRGSHGELGTGDLKDRETPAPVPGMTDVSSLAMGASHACAARKGGDVLCWGDNSSLAAGQPDPPIRFTPVEAKMPAP